MSVCSDFSLTHRHTVHFYQWLPFLLCKCSLGTLAIWDWRWADSLCAGGLWVRRSAGRLGGGVLLVQKVSQLLIQSLNGAVNKLHPAWALTVRLSWPPTHGLLVAWRLGILGGLMCWTLGLGGDCPRLHGRGIRLLQDHWLMGGQLRGYFSSRAGLLVRLICLRGGQTTSCTFINSIYIQRDRWHNSTAWHVRYHGDSRDASLFHRKGFVRAGTSSSMGVFSYTGLRLLDAGFVNVLVLRLHCGLSYRGQRGGGGRTLGG